MPPLRGCLLALALAALGPSCSRTGLEPRRADGGAALRCAQDCDDGLFCNGRERCDPATGQCAAAEAEACDDADECTLDACDESARSCAHEPTPRDEDRDGYDACGGDCDDADPTVHPGADESCDDVDEDCDGQVDEGLVSACGDCRPGCRLLYIPEPGEPFVITEDNSDAVTVDPTRDGALVLTSESSQRYDAWIANTADGKVTKLDTRDGRQLALYDSVLLDGENGAAPPDAICDRNGLDPVEGNCPSRTAVDLQGAVYVANRAFDTQGTLTKIAGFPEDCVDRNGDGEIQTSSDLDGNGQVDRFSPGEYLGQDDECLLWTVDVGGHRSIPRAVAVDAQGYVWVGLFGEERVLKLDPSDGSLLDSVAVTGLSPYGAAMDGRGRLWVTGMLNGQIVSVDTATSQVGRAQTAPATSDECPGSYGIAVDARDRVWIAGFTCPYAYRFDPDGETWLSVSLPDAGVMRGIAADDHGRIFVASSNSWVNLTLDPVFGYFEASDPLTRLTVFDADDGGGVRTFGTESDPLPGRGSIGVGLDNEGRAWLINQDTGSATRVDVDSGEVSHFGVGDLPYTYSDFTGFALRRLVAPTGYLRAVLEGCEQGPSEWEELRVDAELAGGGQVIVRTRSAATREALAATGFTQPNAARVQSLADLPTHRFLEVEARLVAGTRSSSPALDLITVQLHCPR